ncbi:MAG: SDR family NAD(P)-dependent oxidoreductase [Planctomycetia bacterium]|nr:SDR family NAD(P)-dependent oxidoreductase [Planctomycetia bacterium]
MSITGKTRPLAVVTGASSGIGRSFARQLAADGCDLILVARREFVLESLKEELEKQYGVLVEAFPADLTQLDEIQRVEKRLEACENLMYLVNCAGFGTGTGMFPNVDVNLESQMLMLHTLAPMRLSRVALIPMTLHQKGYLINVASCAAFLASRGAADYAATKAFLVSFSRNLQCDCAGRGIHVQALCPGFVRTGFHQSETMKSSAMADQIPRWLWLDADWLVKKSLKQVRKRGFRRVVCVPSFRYKVLVGTLFSWFLSPLRVLFSGGTMR